MRILFTISAIFLAWSLMGQGITSGSITGRVTDKSGVSLPGATVVAVHTASGTTTGTVTSVDGYYRLENLRVGNYNLRASFVGYGDVVLQGVDVRLGETRRLDFNLEEAVLELTTIEVIAQAGNTGESAGVSTQISSQLIENMPTINRDLSDYLKLTPQSQGYSGGTTFGGINNRYNAIYIDGAVNNDVFGLASSGTNGGQTGISPFSMDIIDQFQVALSPYDVSMGGFAGAAINAVTKSGTNNLEGSAYYYMQNEGMVGKTNQSLIDRLTNAERARVADFNKSTYGASLGGPLIKDKAFFFVNAEIQNDVTPAPFAFETYQGDYTQDDMNTLRSFLIESYNYDPGTFGDVEDELKGLKLFGKIDLNLGQKHRLTLRHNLTKGEQYNRFQGTSNTLNFSNNGIYFPSTTNTSAIELNSQIGTSATNNLIIGYTSVLDDRGPIGSDFPYVFINDVGSNVIRLGTEEFSTGNKLTTKTLTLTDNFKIYRGAHTFTFGTHNEFHDIYNLFIGQNYGSYRFASLDDFLNGLPAIQYNRSYSLIDEITGDGSAAAAAFKALQLGVYVQDEWSVNNRFAVTGGLRLDVPILLTTPNHHETFTGAIDLVKEQYDIANDLVANKAPSGQLMFAPRLGFTYDIKGDRKNVIRGGLGIFNSRIPFVWPGAMYNNNGLTLGAVTQDNAGEQIYFRPEIDNQYKNQNPRIPSGDINIFTKDFKYPQVFRTNLGFDTRLPGGLNATIEGVYTKTLNNVLYTNVNNSLIDPKTWTNTPDERIVYKRKNIVSDYTAIYVGSNTNKGYTYSLTASLAKKFDFGLDASLAYTYGDAYALSEGTSSQNSSQWRGQMSAADGRNNPVFGRSDFALGHRVIGALSYRLNWTSDKNVATTITLFYDGNTGAPYSYVIGGNNGRNINEETGSTSANRALIWVPGSRDEINLVQVGSGPSPDQQWEQLNAFIESDPYLSKHRSQYVEKNSNFGPFISYIDLSVRQDLGVKLGNKSHKLQLSWDVFNLANLLNKSWGVRYSIPGDFNYFYLYNFVGYEADGTTPQFNYSYGDKTGTDILNINDFSSRWQMRLGVRYIFN